MRRYLLLLPLLLLLSACTTLSTSPQLEPSPQMRLYRLIIQTNPNIDDSEAKIIASEAIVYSKELARRYGVVTPPLVHNLLVNTGIKDRGLCYHWSDDLYLHLRELRLHSIIMKPVGAYIGSYWQEHNALVLLSKDGDINNGILLDPWRGSGELYFAHIKQDPEYNWKIREDRCIAEIPKAID